METMTVKAFGIIAEKLRQQEFDLPAQKDTGALTQRLYDDYPELKDLKFSVAVNRNLVQENTPLQGSEEIALLPPFSGG